MKKIISLLMLVAVVYAVSSCGVAMSGVNSSRNTGSLTRYTLDKKNFRVLGSAYGQSGAVYVFGIGGMKDATNLAVANMYKDANLSGSQAVVDVYVEKKVSAVLFFWVKVVYEARGTIIEFVE